MYMYISVHEYMYTRMYIYTLVHRNVRFVFVSFRFRFASFVVRVWFNVGRRVRIFFALHRFVVI